MKRRRKAREGVEPLKLMVPVVLPWFLRPDRMSCGARGARGERVGQRPTAGCILPSLIFRAACGSLRRGSAGGTRQQRRLAAAGRAHLRAGGAAPDGRAGGRIT